MLLLLNALSAQIKHLGQRIRLLTVISCYFCVFPHTQKNSHRGTSLLRQTFPLLTQAHYSSVGELTSCDMKPLSSHLTAQTLLCHLQRFLMLSCFSCFSMGQGAASSPERWLTRKGAEQVQGSSPPAFHSRVALLQGPSPFHLLTSPKALSRWSGG